MPHRMTFYLGDKPVGNFRGRALPTGPGRYGYHPYRGVGHSHMTRLLRKGQLAACWFWKNRKKIPLTIVRKEVVEEERRYHWFVVVAELGETAAEAT